MTEQLSGSVALKIKADLENPLDLSIPVDSINYSAIWDIINGTGAGRADKMVHDTRTLAGGGTEDLDFNGGLTDGLGQAYNAVRQRMIFIKADENNPSTITIGNTSATQFLWFFGAATHTLKLQPGAWVCGFTPDATAWPSAAGSTDKLKVLNDSGGSPATYTVIVIGASA